MPWDIAVLVQVRPIVDCLLPSSAAVFDTGDKELSFGDDNSDLFTGVSPTASKVSTIIVASWNHQEVCHS